MDVTLPNGTIIRGVPDDATKEQIKAKAISGGLAQESDFGASTTKPVEEAPAQKLIDNTDSGKADLGILGSLGAGIKRGAEQVGLGLTQRTMEFMGNRHKAAIDDFASKMQSGEIPATQENISKLDQMQQQAVDESKALQLAQGYEGQRREEMSKVSAAHPVATFAGNVAGQMGALPVPALKAASLPLQMLKGGAEGAGLGYSQSTVEGESPAVNAMTTAAIGTALPAVLGGAKTAYSGLKEKLSESSMKKAAAPTVEALKNTAREVYKQIDDLGAVVNSSRVDGLVRDLNSTVKGEGFNSRIHPKVAAALDEFNQVAGTNQPISNIDTLRKVARSAASSMEPDEARLGSIMVGKIDDFVDNLDSKSLIGGNADEVGAKFKDARQLWQRARKADDIDLIFERAKNQASGFENGLRTQFRSLLNNKKRIRGYTPEEVAAMQQVVRGGGIENTAKAIGKFGFSEGQASSMLLGSLGVAGGAAMGGGAGAVAVPLIGQVSKNLAQKLTRNNAELVSQLVRSGKDADSIAKSYFAKVKPENRSAQELAELLISMKAREGLSLKAADTQTKQVISDAQYLLRAYNSQEKEDKK